MKERQIGRGRQRPRKRVRVCERGNVVGSESDEERDRERLRACVRAKKIDR